jgi:FMN-dependent NADH-azoreductase
MTTLLHIDSSANRTSESITRRLTAQYARGWRAVHGDAGYRYRDLAADPVPPLDTAYCLLGRRVERDAGFVPLDKVAARAENEAEERQWSVSLPLIRDVREADTILLGVPMYNWSVPAALKAWIDRIAFPGGFLDPDTGESVLGDTSVVVVAARGGAYGPGTPAEASDFQVPYLRALWRRFGVADENIHCVAAELTLAGLAPHLARRRGEAEASLADARAATTALIPDQISARSVPSGSTPIEVRAAEW